MIICKKYNIALRKLDDRDDVLLLKWLTSPEVLEYYEGRDSNFDLKAIHKKFYNDDTGVTRCIIDYCRDAIGYLQFYHYDELEYGMAASDEVIYGTDQFIGEPKLWNKGIGANLMKMVVEYLIKEKGANRIILDPQCRNVRAIACYEKCGFKKTRFLPESELHEGKLEDCWLMEYKKQASMNIRKLSKNDMPTCVKLIKNSFSTVAKEFGITEDNAPSYVAFATTEEKLLKQYNDGRLMFVCEDDSGQIVGYYSLARISDTECELNNLCVAPDCRHNGIGEIQFEHAVQTAKENKFKSMTFSIVEENTQLKEWYKKLGVEHIGIQKFDFFPFTCGYMKIDL